MALFVARLPFNWGSEDLKRLVSSFGEVTRCDVPANKGYGFVNFKNRDDAERCIKELDGTTQEWGNGQQPGRIAVEWSKGGDQPRGGATGRGCFRCGKEGHFARDCPENGGAGGGRYEDRDRGSRYDDRDRDRSSSRYEDRDRGSRYEDRDRGSSSRYDERDRERDRGSSSRYEDRERTAGSSSRYEDRERTAGSSSRYEDRERTAGSSSRYDDHHRSSRDRSRSRSRSPVKRSRSRSHSHSR